MADENQQSTTVNHEHSIIPFEWAIKKVLGPTFDNLGLDIRAGYEKTKEKIFKSAEKKLKPNQNIGKANLRIAWDIVTQASFTESEIGAEYFGGILAASKTEDGQDDTGIYYLNITKSLSSKQLYLHYLLYKSLNNLFVRTESLHSLNVGMGSEISGKRIYFFTLELLDLGVNVDTDFTALSNKGLIGDFWEVITKKVNHPLTNKEVEIPYAVFTPTTLGIQMLAIAQNKLQEYREFSKSDFGTILDIKIPEFCAFSVEELLKISMTSNVQTIEIDKPIAEVFEFTINPDNTPKWIESIKEEKVNSSPITVGTEYSNTKNGSDWTIYTCTEFEKDRKFMLQQKNSLYHVEYIYEKISDTQTKLTYHEWMENDAVLVEPFEMKILEKLKQVMEV